jgi:hypothetical protein
MITLTVKEAVDRVNNGGDLKDVSIDKVSMQQVNVQDAIVLNRGGIVVPEENLFYDDNDIAYDDEIDELVIGEEITNLSWEEKSARFEKGYIANTSIKINISTEEPEIDRWIEKNKIKLERVLTPIIIDLFKAEKLLQENSPDTKG